MPTFSSSRIESESVRNWPPDRRAHVLLMILGCIVAWLVVRPYEGIVLDAQLYSLQAIATSKPFPLAGDIFLRFGSQNNFTIFSHVVSPLFGWVGIELASAAVVIVSYLALLTGGWLISRRLTGAPAAWLGVGLLITIPGWYGGLDVFRYDEMYLNARVPAEALGALAIACACANRWVFAVAIAALAGAVHPVMAVPAWGLLLLIWTDRIVAPRLGDQATAYVALIGATVIAALVWLIGPTGDGSQEQWIETLRSRTSYAFLQNWRIEDWLQNVLPLATLLTTSTVLDTRLARRLSLLVALIGVIGLALAWVASTVPGFERLLLAQSWRWMWLARFVAVVLLPGTVLALLRSGTMGRSSAVLLASGWALFGYSGGAIAAASALAWLARGKLPIEVHRTLRLGAYVVGLAAISLLVTFSAQAIPLDFDNNVGPVWVQRLIDAGGLSGPSALAIVGVWWVSAHAESRPLAIALGATLAVCLAGLVGYNLARFEEPRYSKVRYAQFETWRRIIPPSAEVLWFQDPAAVWTLLERKSYLSGSQSAGLMYSPLATREFLRRSQALAPLASPGFWTLVTLEKDDYPKKLTLDILAEICREPTLGFVVSPEELDGFTSTAVWPSGGHYVFLYDCAAYRGGASP